MRRSRRPPPPVEADVDERELTSEELQDVSGGGNKTTAYNNAHSSYYHI